MIELLLDGYNLADGVLNASENWTGLVHQAFYQNWQSKQKDQVICGVFSRLLIFVSFYMVLFSQVWV